MIYYSHVNEDSRIERELLRQCGCRTVVAVAGSGERLLALMDEEACQEFYAVDLNEEALFLLQLKLAALQHLRVEEYWQFCGHHPAPAAQRVQWYHEIKERLTLSCLLYWQEQTAMIRKGILNTGHFERFLQRVRPLIGFFLGKDFLHSRPANEGARDQFPHRRWKLLQWLFSLSWVYKAAGNRDAAFVGRGAVVSHIPAALDRIIRQGKARSSFMIHLIFRGHLRDMDPADLPLSLQKEVLQRIKQRLALSRLRIHFHHSDLLNFVEKKVAGAQQVFYSLSDILSFEEPDYLQQLLDNTIGEGNTVVWRAFLRNRADSMEKTRLNRRYPGVQENTEEESTGMYQVFSLTHTKNKKYEPAPGTLP